MNRYKLYKQSLAVCLLLVVSFSCTEEQSDLTFIGSDSANLNPIIRITTDSGIPNNDSDPADINTLESINRLDIFVYNETGELFAHSNSSSPGKDLNIVTLKDTMGLNKIKDVFVVANLDEQQVENLKKESRDGIKNFILTSPQQFSEADSLFRSANLMSASALQYDFSKDRVLDIHLKRIYSKVRVKFVYDFSEEDSETILGKSVEPIFVKASMKRIEGLPEHVSLFSQSLTIPDVSWDITNFPDSIPLLINGEEITEMNNVMNSGENRIYDFLSNKPCLKLFPTASRVTIPLSLQLYEQKDTPSVVEFTRNISLEQVEANTDYLITIHINRMDGKTRTSEGAGDTVDCWYEISASPYNL